jgi:hypothetical protein
MYAYLCYSQCSTGFQKRRLVENLEVSDPDSIASNPPEVLADYLAGLQAKVFTEMSEVELNDIRIQGMRSQHLVGSHDRLT